jgi:hypothetical protein
MSNGGTAYESSGAQYPLQWPPPPAGMQQLRPGAERGSQQHPPPPAGAPLQNRMHTVCTHQARGREGGVHACPVLRIRVHTHTHSSRVTTPTLKTSSTSAPGSAARPPPPRLPAPLRKSAIQAPPEAGQPLQPLQPLQPPRLFRFIFAPPPRRPRPRTFNCLLTGQNLIERRKTKDMLGKRAASARTQRRKVTRVCPVARVPHDDTPGAAGLEACP